MDAESERAVPPLSFGELRADDFVAWLVTLQKGNGKSPGLSTFNNHRAALFNLFREYRVSMSAELQSELTTMFRGIKRSVAEQTANGQVSIKVGKDPLDPEVYEFLCIHMLTSCSKGMAFARAFLVITWNLMCRSSNTVGIMNSHISWRGDAMCVFFAHMKNDQIGTRPSDPRYIYANPLRPAICPNLALAVYWAVYTIDRDCGAT
ncbi:hypothetical protein ATCC90586_012238 [Pythium insidiosum]|nr:hypothetical protein ATCC90586_012238 [Pythium insidiosum]